MTQHHDDDRHGDPMKQLLIIGAFTLAGLAITIGIFIGNQLMKC